MPLVRDCSCRGDSAGFAHLSCLVSYAEQKSKQADEGDIAAFAEPWKVCNNCKQLFQGQMAIDLSSAFASFTAATHDHAGNSMWDILKVLFSLQHKILMLAMHGNEAVRTERTMLINSMLSIINQTKRDLNMSRWIHMPKASEEYQYYKLLCGDYEASAYEHLGNMLLGDTSEDSIEIMLMHWKKARAIYNLVGKKDDAQQIDTIISVYSDADASSTTNNAALQEARIRYELDLKTHGMNSALDSGLLYAQLLQRFGSRTIEAERLATKLAMISRQVHGPEHRFTIKADELLKRCKERYVYVPPDAQEFQALRYENDGEICVVQGPVTKPRNMEDERIYHVDSHLIIPCVDCTVICHGLVSASHLNGELGVARDVKKSGTGIRFAVHFEKKNLKSAFVKPENLRIAFELPSEKLPIESGN
jgi:hypothetical protein